VLGAGSSRFRGREARDDAPVGGAVEVGEVRAKLQEALDYVLSSGSAGIDKEKSMAEIKAKMLPTFMALPKASENRLGPRAVHHILRSYFSQVHGWSLFGFQPEAADEPTSNNASATAVLQEKVPAIMEAVMEAREHGAGLTLPEVVAVAAALERLILDESVKLLHMSYDMNGYDDEDALSRHMANEVLVTYMALFSLPNKTGAANVSPESHHRWKRQRRTAGKLLWEGEVAQDSLINFDFERQGSISPFQPPSYNFETTASIVDVIAKQYGRRQDEGCRVMREALESHDHTGTGRVTLDDFHSVGSVSFFVLNEPAERLKEMGVLDESDPRNPTVRIANYVLSPGNCNRNSNYYHVCCISTCDSILQELEAKFMAPSVDPELLLNVLTTNMSTTADIDFNIAASPLLGPSAEHLAKSLRTIAAKHGGVVPLHGKLFSTWMHFAFPRDCPLPAREVKLNGTEDEVAMMKQVAPAEWASDMDFHMPADDISWTHDEDVSLFEDMKLIYPKSESSFRAALRWLAMACACIGFLSISVQQIGEIRKALGMTEGKKARNDENFLLPMRF